MMLLTPAASSAVTAHMQKKMQANFDTFVPLMNMMIKTMTSNPMQQTKPDKMMGMMTSLLGQQQAAYQTDMLKHLEGAVTSLQGFLVSALSSQFPIRFNSNQFTHSPISLPYNIGPDVLDAVINVNNGDGDIVRTLKASAQPGNHTVFFDYQDNDGHPLDPNVTYEYSVKTRKTKDGVEKEHISDKKSIPAGHQTSIGYTLSQSVPSAFLEITNHNGRVIQKTAVDSAAGSHEVSFAGQPGTYRFNVVGPDSKPIPESATFISAKPGIERDQSGLHLNVMGQKFLMRDIYGSA